MPILELSNEGLKHHHKSTPMSQWDVHPETENTSKVEPNGNFRI